MKFRHWKKWPMRWWVGGAAVLAAGILFLSQDVPESVPAHPETKRLVGSSPVTVPPPPTPAVNAAPEIVTLRLGPPGSIPGDQLQVEVTGHDPDGDPVSYDFAWYRNGEYLFGVLQDNLDSSGFRKGDQVVATVTPSDGRAAGPAKTSEPLVLANRAPEITSQPPAEMIDGKYTYAVRAVDPDGDPLIYSLDTAAAGMHIDSESGQLIWAPATSGPFAIAVAVSDGEMKTVQNFTLTVPEKAAAPTLP